MRTVKELISMSCYYIEDAEGIYILYKESLKDSSAGPKPITMGTRTKCERALESIRKVADEL